MKVDYVYRINLKTGGSTIDENRIRKDLIKFCLDNPLNQYVAIGWSYTHKEVTSIQTYSEYYEAVKATTGRIPAALNIFQEVEEDSLFWTRDTDGCYWICRAKGPAENYCNIDLDIGAVVPVEAFSYGREVPGQIKAAFNRNNAGTAQRIRGRDIYEFSKYVFNEKSGRNVFSYSVSNKNDVINNLPDFELEELVISYIQIIHDYYVLSSSIANKSTTVKIECEFRSRNLETPTRAVVQVKAGDSQRLLASEFSDFINRGYYVFIYCPEFDNDTKSDSFIRITREQLLDFYIKYKPVLSDSITRWENLFS